jgi:hypothetical protein
MPAETVRSASVTVNMQSFAHLAREMKRAAPLMYKEIHHGLKDIGGIVADEARKNAAYSEKIAKSIKVRARGFTVSVVASGRLAELEEMGKKGTPGRWRHPLFGDRLHWYDQQSRPFLYPALKSKAELIDLAVWTLVGSALDYALEL